MYIIIPGTPHQSDRMRSFIRKGKVNLFDPKAREKKAIRAYLNSQVNDSYKMIEHPRISFMFHMPIPKSASKKDLLLMEGGKLKHEKKPDTDNLVKLYMDCMDGIIFQNDQKVMLGPCVKLYHPIPKTVIFITETSETITPWELDQAFFAVEECGVPSFSETDYLPGSYNLWLSVHQQFFDS